MNEKIKYMFKNKTFMIGTIMVLSMFVLAIFANQIAPYGYDEAVFTEALKEPSSAHLLGTDQLGRDLFSRIVYGTRIAMTAAGIAVILQTIIGVSVGLLSGFYGGKVDKVFSFITDLTWSIPPLIMALAVVTILGKSLNNVIIAISIVSWAQYARIVRAKAQVLKNLPFVEMGVTLGEKDRTLMFKYILPNIVPSIIVIATISIPSVILATTSLGFLGMGAQPPLPDWGVMLSEGVKYMSRAKWLAIYPGLAIVYTVLGFNLFGEGLRDVLDPRLKV